MLRRNNGMVTFASNASAGPSQRANAGAVGYHDQEWQAVSRRGVDVHRVEAEGAVADDDFLRAAQRRQAGCDAEGRTDADADADADAVDQAGVWTSRSRQADSCEAWCRARHALSVRP